MTTTIRLTSKRQATFPKELCDSLGLKPGDDIELIARVENGERFWLLHPKDKPERKWFGSLRKYADKVDDHSMNAIRDSVRRGRRSTD